VGGQLVTVAEVGHWMNAEPKSALRAHGQPLDEALLPYLSPLGWEHINLTGDYSWRTKRAPGNFQPLRPLSRP